MVNRQERRRDRDDKRKGGFRYVERDAKSLKDRAEQRGGSFDSIFKSGTDTFRPRVGNNSVRILPPTWENPEHYGYDVFVHSYVGPDSSTYLCLNKMKNERCPICEEAKAAKDDGETEEAKELGYKKATLLYVLDREEDDNKPLVWQISWSMDKDIAALGTDPKSGKVLDVDHPDRGYDLFFKRQGQGLKTKYNGHSFDRDETPICEKEKDQDEVIDFITENPIPDLLDYKSADYLEKVMSGTGASSKDKDKDEDDDRGDRRRGRDDDDDRGSRRRGRDDDDDKGDDDRGSRRSRRGDDDDDSKDDDRRGSRRGRDDDDDGDKKGDDDGDDRSSRRSRRGDDDDKGEDDRGSRRGRRGDDDDDDKGGDDDDRGSRRRGRDDDDDKDEDDRGSRRSRRGDDDDDKSERRSSRRGRDDDGGDDDKSERRGGRVRINDDDDDKGSGRRGSRRGR
jgi:hypothetical protein